MSQSLLPSRSDVTFEPREEYTLCLDDENADDVFDALGVPTRRQILQHVYREPMTASQLASAVDTSVQNVTHHLGTLEDADLVTVVDTWYSSRGCEMAVYAPSSRALVVYCSDAGTTDG